MKKITLPPRWHHMHLLLVGFKKKKSLPCYIICLWVRRLRLPQKKVKNKKNKNLSLTKRNFPQDVNHSDCLISWSVAFKSTHEFTNRPDVCTRQSQLRIPDLVLQKKKKNNRVIDTRSIMQKFYNTKAKLN